MKLIIEEILSSKGLRWKDLADRTGRDQSNLRASLKKNPTMAILGEVAEALGLSIPELFEGGTTMKKPLGRVQIGGQLYELTEPSDKALRIPEYNDYSELRERITKFIKEHTKKGKPAGMVGILDSFELFSLSFDGRGFFHLVLTVKNGITEVYTYDRDEFAVEWDDEERAIWNLPEVTDEIIRDLECAMLKYNMPNIHGSIIPRVKVEE